MSMFAQRKTIKTNSTRKWVTAVLLMTVLATSAPMPAYALMAWNTNCRQILADWKNRPGHKAFAIGMNHEGQYCHSVWSAPSKEAAMEKALKYCQKASSRPCTIQSAE
jgi:hypothetical protein